MAMKFRTLKRHFKEGLKNSWRNSWMTLASVAAVTTTLLLVAVFLALVFNLNHIASGLEEDVQIKVLVDQTANEEEMEELSEELEGLDNVESVVFSSRDEEWQDLMTSMGDQGEAWGLFEQDNPLNDAFVVTAEEPQDTVAIANVIIEDFDYVERVNYGQDFVQNLFTFNNYARIVGAVLIIALVFTAIFLISNTIKITIIARRKEIEIMKLVGATNWFIRWPFFVEGLLLGILGSILPIAVLFTGYYYIDQNMSAVNQFDFVQLLPFTPFVWQLAGLILLIGAVIGVWGSVMSVRKFLKV